MVKKTKKKSLSAISEPENKPTSKEVEMPEEIDFYISGLHNEINEGDLLEHFEKLGEISSIKLLDNPSGRNRGMAFIKFGICDQEAVLSLNKTEWKGRKIRVKLASDKHPKQKIAGETNTVYVGNIPHDASEDTIGGHFEKFGTIKEVRIARSLDGTSREFCYVQFNQNESAVKAVAAHGSLIDGRMLKVDLAEMFCPTENKSEYNWNLDL